MTDVQPVEIHCPHCNYNLHGLPDNRCPECGEIFDPAALRDLLDKPVRRLRWRYILVCSSLAPLSLIIGTAARLMSHEAGILIFILTLFIAFALGVGASAEIIVQIELSRRVRSEFERAVLILIMYVALFASQVLFCILAVKATIAVAGVFNY